MLKQRPLLLIINIFFFLSFLGFAYLNLNDVDPYIWVPLYLAPTFCCGAIAFKSKFYPQLYLLIIVGCTIYAGYYFFCADGVLDWINKYHEANIVGQMHADKPYIEQTREFGGLMIVVFVMLGDYLAAKTKRS